MKNRYKMSRVQVTLQILFCCCFYLYRTYGISKFSHSITLNLCLVKQLRIITYKNGFLSNFNRLMMLSAPYLLEPFLLCSPHVLLQFTDSLTTETTLSEVRVGQFFLPVFHRGQVWICPSPSYSFGLSYQPEVSAEFLVSPQWWLIRQRWLPDLRQDQALSVLHRK